MSDGLLLGIDTASEHLALALVERGSAADTLGGAVIASRSPHLGREHAARILTELDELLAEVGASKQDLVAVGVGVGPGSYTGVRVGVATAKALGTALAVPVGGSPSLLTQFTEALAPGERALAVSDARRGNVYALLARRIPDERLYFEPIGEPRKLARTLIEERYPGLEVYGGPPDASVLARRALLEGPVEAYYL